MAYSTKLPTNPFASYWPYWNPVRRLVNIPTTFNVIILFSAHPVGDAPGSTGAVYFNSVGATDNRYSGDPNTFMNADIATCRARGQRIILSVGGAGHHIYIQNQTRADAFIASIKSINVQLGGSGTTNVIDGIDFNNFEFMSSADVSPTWMTYVGQQLKAYYGSDFLIMAPPLSANSATSPTNQAVVDKVLMATMYDGEALDWMAPQFYEGSANTPTKVRDSLTYYNSAITINGHSVQIPQSIIGVGFGIRTATWTATNYWILADAITEWNFLVSSPLYNPKGTFNWAFHLDPTNTFTQLAPYVTNYVEALTPHFSLVASTQFTNGAATTAQLTAPSGKTSGADFQAGSINETSNPAASLDLASGKYTELEWCINANTEAVNAQQYEFRVTYNGTSLDTYSVTPKWTIGTPPQPPDTTAPTTPTNLNAVTASSSQINLTWTASTDAIGVSGYKIYRGGVQVATSATNSYVDTGLTPSTLYSYTVSAYDAATNESAQSSSDSDTTLAASVGDTTPPEWVAFSPANNATVSGSSVTLSATVTDDVGVQGVTFYVDGVTIGDDTTGVGDVFSVQFDSTAVANGTYELTMVPRDAAGNVSAQGTFIIVNNVGAPPLVPDPAKSCVGVGAMTGVSSITL